jgi:hypothetical protein
VKIRTRDEATQPHVLECDLRIEHQGGEFIARFPTLASLMHLATLGWAHRRTLPAQIAVRVEWKSLSFQVR